MGIKEQIIAFENDIENLKNDFKEKNDRQDEGIIEPKKIKDNLLDLSNKKEFKVKDLFSNVDRNLFFDLTNEETSESELIGNPEMINDAFVTSAIGNAIGILKQIRDIKNDQIIKSNYSASFDNIREVALLTDKVGRLIIDPESIENPNMMIFQLRDYIVYLDRIIKNELSSLRNYLFSKSYSKVNNGKELLEESDLYWMITNELPKNDEVLINKNNMKLFKFKNSEEIEVIDYKFIDDEIYDSNWYWRLENQVLIFTHYFITEVISDMEIETITTLLHNSFLNQVLLFLYIATKGNDYIANL